MTASGPALDPERRSALLGVKLAALARDHLAFRAGAPGPLPGGATVRDGSRGAVLAEAHPGRALGTALAWARQNGIEELHVIVEGDAGLLARRASAFRRPPAVWRARGRELEGAEPEPIPPSPVPPPAAVALAPQLAAAGADVVVEHGVVTGEVLGLEVARVVVDDEHGARVEAGVGRHDREAFSMIHGGLAAPEALAAVVAAARTHRSPGAPQHPLGRLAAERWLREVVMAAPALAGARSLERHQGPAPRPNVKEPWPAVAVGEGDDGRPVVAVFSVGIDLDLVPYAADARLAADPSARLALVVPERDAHPVTVALAAALADPADVIAVTGDWRAAAGT